MMAGSGLGTAQEVAVPLADRARGAELVVVGQVTSSQAMWRVNEHGDRLIVSVLRVTREETLKGSPAQTLEVEVEGGTIGDLTLRVSDLPVFVPGDRAVFYVRRNAQKRLVPYLRGQGLLKLDRSNRVPASSLSLDEIRRTVGRAGR
jgi:dipeptidyl aminopeptidase/acylaminoacyl peptidase